jgi:hypothetical protein
MQSNKLKSRHLRRSLLATAAGLCLASAVMAQQTNGSIGGRAASGDTITVEEKSINVTRAVRVAATAPGSSVRCLQARTR